MRDINSDASQRQKAGAEGGMDETRWLSRKFALGMI